MWRMFGRRALTRLELALYAVIVGIAVTVFLDRLFYVMELAERSAMEQTVSRVNTAINVRLAYEMLNGRLINVPAALERNPFELAKTVPPNFAGEVDAPDLARIERASWIYDRTSHELVYLPRLRRGLDTPDSSNAIRFRLVAGRGGARYMLVPASKYTWE